MKKKKEITVSKSHSIFIKRRHTFKEVIFPKHRYYHGPHTCKLLVQYLWCFLLISLIKLSKFECAIEYLRSTF